MSEETTVEDAQYEMKRAYMLLSAGHALEGIEACQKAAELAPEHHLPPTMEGAFLIALGRIKDALGHLRKVMRKHPDEPLPRIYFAEACLLDSRTRRGFKELERAEEQDTKDEHAEMIGLLRQSFEAFDDREMPEPLVIPD